MIIARIEFEVILYEAILDEKGVGILTITATLILEESEFEVFCCSRFVGRFRVEQNYDCFFIA